MKWLPLCFILFLSACSGLPHPMRDNSYATTHLSLVKTNITAYKDMPLRWGGTIINVLNEKDSSQIQALFYPISNYGRPRIDRKTEGRFAMTSPLFLDPAIFKEGTEFTVTGILSGEIKHKIGKKSLSLPLLTIEQIHLWPAQQQQDDRFYPYPRYYYPYYRYGPYYHDYYY